jgi:hypothetical protein
MSGADRAILIEKVSEARDGNEAAGTLNKVTQ